MCVFIPWAIAFSERTVPIRDEITYAVYQYTTCMEVWPSVSAQKAYFLGVVFLTCYVIPLCFIAVFYLMIGIKVWKRSVAGIRGTRAERNIHLSKIRIVRMLLVVFVMFALSWLPLYSLRLRQLFGPIPSVAEKTILREYITPFVQWLGAANSCMNPFIYCYFSTQFRRSIITVLQSRSCATSITNAWYKHAIHNWFICTTMTKIFISKWHQSKYIDSVLAAEHFVCIEPLSRGNSMSNNKLIDSYL